MIGKNLMKRGFFQSLHFVKASRARAGVDGGSQGDALQMESGGIPQSGQSPAKIKKAGKSPLLFACLKDYLEEKLPK